MSLKRLALHHVVALSIALYSAAGLADSGQRRSGFVDVPGGPVWYEIMGDGNGVPLLTLHGGPGGTSCGAQLLAPLGGERPVVRYDQLGSGRSGRPDDPSLWQRDRFVAELDAVREALDLRQIHLHGHSWGGALAAYYVLQTGGEGVLSLTLSSPLISTPRWIEDANLLRAELPASVQAVLDEHEAAGTTDSAAYREAEAEFYARHVTLGEAVEQADCPGAPRNAEIYEQMWGPSEFRATGSLLDFDLTPRLGEIDVPTLFITGEFDEARPETLREFAAAVPGAQLVILPGVAHASLSRAPQRYRQVLRDFVRGAESADLVLLNGGIYTVNPQRPWAQAAAVRNGVFVTVGDNAEVETLIGPQTRVIDLAGRMVLPGFHDAHVHPRLGGTAMLGCNLAGLDSVEAILDTVAACAREGEGWILGYAFDLGLFGEDGPHRELLDAVTRGRPAFMEAADGHNGWANSRALAVAGVDRDTQSPELGVIERDADGTPSGTLRESAMALVTDSIPPPTQEQDTAAVAAGLGHLSAQGITSLIDASVGERDYRAYQELEARGELPARVLTSLTWGPAYAYHRGEDFERVLRERQRFESARLRHGGIKIFLDGVLEGETAALVEPYLNNGHHSGELIVPPAELAAVVTRFDALGLQVHMHAIGDLAVREGLDAIQAAREANGARDNRHHIAHLQLIHDADVPRFADLDVAANFQALWAYPDDFIMKLNLPVVGEARVQRMYPIASVQRAGGRIVGGSDWNVTSAYPLDAIETAVLRQDPWSSGGLVLNEAQRVDLATMIEAYTINGAWLMKHEHQVGSIEVGKLADLVILDRNLFAIPPQQINEARVLEVLLEGETVHAAAAEEPVPGAD